MTDLKHLQQEPPKSSHSTALLVIAQIVIIAVLFGFVVAELPRAIDKELDARSAQAAAVQGVSRD